MAVDLTDIYRCHALDLPEATQSLFYSKAPKKAFLTHGAERSSQVLAELIRQDAVFEIEVPEQGWEVELS